MSTPRRTIRASVGTPRPKILAANPWDFPQALDAIAEVHVLDVPAKSLPVLLIYAPSHSGVAFVMSWRHMASSPDQTSCSMFRFFVLTDSEKHEHKEVQWVIPKGRQPIRDCFIIFLECNALKINMDQISRGQNLRIEY